MNHRGAYNNFKHAKSFCHMHFNGFDLQGVYHPQEQHCATATWGGRAKDAHVQIIKADPQMFRAQSQMHAQQDWEKPVSQGGGSKALNAVRVHQGSNTEIEATKEGGDNTRAVDGALSSDVSLELLDLMSDGMGYTEFIPTTHPGAFRNQQGANTGVMTDTALTHPSNIRVP
jgi:hypothetical protein